MTSQNFRVESGITFGDGTTLTTAPASSGGIDASADIEFTGNLSIPLATTAWHFEGISIVGSASSTDKFYVSTDGVTWSEKSFPSNYYWKILEKVGNRYILIGENGSTFYSESLDTWTQGAQLPISINSAMVTSLSTVNNAIVYSPNSNDVAVTTDGASWSLMSTMTNSSQPITLGQPYQMYNGSIVYNKVLVTESGLLAYTYGLDSQYITFLESSDGISWTPKSVSNIDYMMNAATSGGVLAKSGNTYIYAHGQMVQSSTDLISWTSNSLSAGYNIYNVVGTADGFFATGTNTDVYPRPYLGLYSVDGIEWTAGSPISIDGMSSWESDYAYEILPTKDGLFSRVGYYGRRIIKNTGGASWTYDSALSNILTESSPGFWGMVSYGSRTKVTESLTASVTSNIPLESKFEYLSDFVFGGKYDSMYGGQGIYKTKDFITWAPVSTKNVQSVANSVFFAYSSTQPNIDYSVDGANWTTITITQGMLGSYTQSHPESVAYANGTYFIPISRYDGSLGVSLAGYLYSTDLVSWTRGDLQYGESPSGSYSNNGQFVSYFDGKYIFKTYKGLQYTSTLGGQTTEISISYNGSNINPQNIQQIVQTSGRLLLLTSLSSSPIFYTTNGVDWTFLVLGSVVAPGSMGSSGGLGGMLPVGPAVILNPYNMGSAYPFAYSLNGGSTWTLGESMDLRQSGTSQSPMSNKISYSSKAGLYYALQETYNYSNSTITIYYKKSSDLSSWTTIFSKVIPQMGQRDYYFPGLVMSVKTSNSFNTAADDIISSSVPTQISNALANGAALASAKISASTIAGSSHDATNIFTASSNTLMVLKNDWQTSKYGLYTTDNGVDYSAYKALDQMSMMSLSSVAIVNDRIFSTQNTGMGYALLEWTTAGSKTVYTFPSNYSPTSEPIQYLNGKYIVMSYKNMTSPTGVNVAYSTDLSSWSNVSILDASSGTGYTHLAKIGYVSGTWIIVSDRLHYSSSLESPFQILNESETNTDLQSPERLFSTATNFVILKNGKILTSTNGTSWTASTPTISSLIGTSGFMMSGDAMLLNNMIVMAYGNAFAYSTNGITWTTGTSAISILPGSMGMGAAPKPAYSRGKYYLKAYSQQDMGYRIYVSSNLISWTVVGTLSSNDQLAGSFNAPIATTLNAIVEVKASAIAVEKSATVAKEVLSASPVISSPTISGGTVSLATLKSDTLFEYPLPTYIANNYTTSNDAVYSYSEDGMTWTLKTASISDYMSSYSLSVTNIVHDGTSFVSSYNDYVHRSNDGITWTRTNLNPGLMPGIITPGDRRLLSDGVGTILAIPNTSGQSVRKSTNNGASWTDLGNIGYSDFYTAEYVNGKYILSNSYQDIPVYSTDGTTWTQISVPDLVNNGSVNYSITYGNGVYIAVGSGLNDIFYSTDLSSWTTAYTSSTPFAAFPNATYGNGKFVVLADGGAPFFYSSTDGLTWTQESVVAPTTWAARLMFAGGKFYVWDYMTQTTHWVSSNLTTWTQIDMLKSSIAKIFYGEIKKPRTLQQILTSII